MNEQAELFGEVGGLFGPDTIATTPLDQLDLPREGETAAAVRERLARRVDAWPNGTRRNDWPDLDRKSPHPCATWTESRRPSVALGRHCAVCGWDEEAHRTHDDAGPELELEAGPADAGGLFEIEAPPSANPTVCSVGARCPECGSWYGEKSRWVRSGDAARGRACYAASCTERERTGRRTTYPATVAHTAAHLVGDLYRCDICRREVTIAERTHTGHVLCTSCADIPDEYDDRRSPDPEVCDGYDRHPSTIGWDCWRCGHDSAEHVGHLPFLNVPTGPADENHDGPEDAAPLAPGPCDDYDGPDDCETYCDRCGWTRSEHDTETPATVDVVGPAVDALF